MKRGRKEMGEEEGSRAKTPRVGHVIVDGALQFFLPNAPRVPHFVNNATDKTYSYATDSSRIKARTLSLSRNVPCDCVSMEENVDHAM